MNYLHTTCQRIVQAVRGDSGALSLRTVFQAPGVEPLAAPEPPPLQEGDLLALLPQGWRVLAEAGSPLAALYEILIQHDLNPLFSAQIRREVDAWVAAPGLDDPSLEDLSHLAFVTIDNHDSKDLDQAMFIQPAPQGGYLVWYALADASHFVRPGTALFEEALRRGVTYYLPALNVPMLPPQLSEDLVSLNPQVPRRALVFRMHLCEQCVKVDTTLLRARIFSRAKLTYPGVQSFHDAPEGHELAGHDYTETLELLREVGQLRIAEADRRDVVRYDRAHIAVRLLEDHDGKALGFGAAREERLDVERWNEQISLLCNGEGALFLRDDAIKHPHVQPIFRIHGAPPESRLEEIEETVKHMIEAHGLDRARWLWRPQRRQGDGGESVAEYLARLPSGGEFARVREAIERLFLMANQRSSFSEEPGMHFALGVEPYSRFSAPMREMVGVFTHKEALEKLDPSLVVSSDEVDEALREQVIETANRSRSLQRALTKEVQKLAIDALLARDLLLPPEQRPRRKGTICGLRRSRIYVRLDDPPMEIKSYVEDVEQVMGCSYTLEEGGVALVSPAGPTLRVGDEVALWTAGLHRGRWQLVPAPLEG